MSFSQEKNEKSNDEQSFQLIENMPVYKGCEDFKTNQTRKRCTSDKINKLISKNFNGDLANTLGLTNGIVSIFTRFKINKEGEIIEIEARGPHPELEQEAIRVIGLIPNMKPGLQRGKPVVVPFAVPIKFHIENSAKQTFPLYRGCDKTLSFLDTRRCSIQKIKDFIKLSFDYDIANRALPLEKSTKFLVEFTIDKKGRVKNVNAKAQHKAIAIEAIKTVKRLPRFKLPGTSNGQKTDTPVQLEMTIYF